MAKVNLQIEDQVYKIDVPVFYIINDMCNEIERLHKIINDVKEYIMTELITEWDIKNDGYVSGSDLPVDVITPILEILDKGEDDNVN